MDTIDLATHADAINRAHELAEQHALVGCLEVDAVPAFGGTSGNLAA